MDALYLPSLTLRVLLGGGLGLLAGSFIAAASLRWPRDETILTGRSRCDSCAAPLGPLELVPLLSFALLRGRCRRCAARIDPRHPAIEAMAALLGATAMAAHPWPLGIVSALFGWWLLLIAIIDLEHHWLPDRLTLPLVPLGLLGGWAGFGPPLVPRLLGALAGWVVLAAIALAYRRLRGREGMGGGDPRLLGALGAWLGFASLPFILLGAGLLGLGAILTMALRGRPVDGATRLPLGSLLALAAWPLWLLVAIQPLSSLIAS